MIDKWRDVLREISEEQPVHLATTIRAEESNEDDAFDEYFHQLDEFTSGQSRSNCSDLSGHIDTGLRFQGVKKRLDKSPADSDHYVEP